MRARALQLVTAAALAVTAVSASLAVPPAAAAAEVPVLIRTTDTSGWPSSDPSGIAYDSGEDRLIVVDGEIEESNLSWLYKGYNGYVATRDGSLDRTFNTVAASPTNNEPVGAGYDPARDELYISKDGSSSRIWVYAERSGRRVHHRRAQFSHRRQGCGGGCLRRRQPVRLRRPAQEDLDLRSGQRWRCRDLWTIRRRDELRRGRARSARPRGPRV